MMLEGVVMPTLLVTSSPKQVLLCLWEVSWHDLHTTGFFCKAVQPGLVLISLLLFLPLGDVAGCGPHGGDEHGQQVHGPHSALWLSRC